MAISINTNFNQHVHYKVVEIINNDNVIYKIIQPRRYFLFFTKYYPVKETILTSFGYTKRIRYFKNKKEVDEFVIKNTFQIIHKETIVYDSIKNP